LPDCHIIDNGKNKLLAIFLKGKTFTVSFTKTGTHVEILLYVQYKELPTLTGQGKVASSELH
jgi:hypothetical protein